MANLFETTFESGSDGSPIDPIAEGFESASGTISYDSLVVAHGQYAAKLIPASGVGYLQWYAGAYPTGDFWGRQYVHIDQAIAVPVHLVAFFDGALQKASIVLMPDGRISLRNSSLSIDRITSATVWAPSQWMRLEWRINWSTDEFEVWVYTDPDGTLATAHIVFPAGIGIPKWHRIRFGVSYSGTDSYVTHWDNIALSQTGAIGASPPDVVISATLAYAWTGGMTATGAQIKIKTSNAISVQLAYAINPGSGDPLTGTPSTSPILTPDGNGMATFTLDGLTESTAYVYGVIANGVLLADRVHFSTMPRGAANFTVVFSSSQADASDHVVFDAIRNRAPKIFFHLGGLYASTLDTDDVSAARARYDTQLQAGTKRFKNLLANVPVDYVWNDTDWGGVGGDQDNPAAPALVSAYQQYVPTYPLPDANSALYHSVAIGRVLFLVLDVRSRRGSASMLGPDQKQWLKDQLITPTYPVKVIVCPLPWRTSSEWGGFVDEFAEINAYITDNNLTNVLMIGGTEHALAADSGANSGVNRPNLIAGALDATGALATGTWDHDNHANAAGAGQYGLLTVSDSGGSTITCTYTGWNQVDAQQIGPYAVTSTLSTHRAQVKRWDGTQWSLVTPRVQLATGWKIPAVRVWDGTAWRTI
jgi:hypothetical protein